MDNLTSSISKKESGRWIPGLTDSKRKAKPLSEDHELLSVIALSDDITEEASPKEKESETNGVRRDLEAALPLGPPPPQPPAPGRGDPRHQGGGCWVSFKDVTYTVKTRKRGILTLLNKVEGYFKPGEITALMGGSGSGKTTLLDVISGRKTTGEVSGTILYNFELPTRRFLRQGTGYVEQFDTLVENLTVEEMLLYTAEMKLPVGTGIDVKKSRVEELVAFLGLDTCRKTIIGSATKRGVSGGQAKRVNIGVSLITDPQVLYLDEPTSGLDSFTADEVMSFVAKFAREFNRAVCATIHSPTPRTFAVFDRLMLLVAGRLVYAGPCGLPAVRYFVDNKLAKREFVPPHDSEAEWLVELVTGATKDVARCEELATAYSQSALHAYVVQTLAAEAHQERPPKGAGHRHTNSKEFREDLTSPVMPAAVPMSYALRTMFMYRTLRNYQNGLFMSARLVDKVIMLSIMVTLFVHKGRQENLAGAQMTAAALFMWVAAPNFGAAAYLPTIMLERPLFYREVNDGMYSQLTYYLHKWIEEIIIAVPSSLLFNGVLWVSIGLQGSYGTLWLAWLVTQLTAIALAFVFATVSPTLDFANGAVPSYGATLLFFTGFLINFDNIPPWWTWYSYITYLRYPYTAMMRNQFDFRGRDASFMVCNTEESIITWFGMDRQPPPWACILILTLWLACFSTLGYLALRYVRYNAR